jgi:1-acyl-sn-glycerol-3-phosphate acyltransferase
MLQAEHSRLHQWLLHQYIARRSRGNFHSIRLTGAIEQLSDKSAYPIVFYGNHHTWWDGFLDLTIARRFAINQYVMMDAAQLERFIFFKKCGVFGVDLSSTTGRSASLLYAIRLLKERTAEKRALFLYPHGRLQVTESGPIPPFQPGLATLLRKSPQACAVPVYHWFRFGKHPRAEVFIHLGEPIVMPDSANEDLLVERLQNARDTLQEYYRDPERAIEINDPGIWLLSPPGNYRGKT